ncbi:MAG: sigma-70 family RNA polymerase sigma factor [Cyclobacteriaceae bacterium]
MTQAQTIVLYQPILQGIAMKMLRCKADAEDVVQETFIKWLSQEQEKIKNTKAYLIKAVTNNCINHLNSIRNKRIEYLESFHWPEFIEKFKESTDFSHIDIETELAKAFQVLQNKLEPLERAVYVLKEVFDFDYKALQELLDKKQDHCRQLFSRAKRKLQDETDNFNSVFQPKKTALIESFRKACEFGQPSDLVAQLRMN